jgi:hypothetical protein
MTRRQTSFEQWLQDAPALRAKSDRLMAAFGEIRRDKPRDAAEAEFLRRVGTPERLIGPIR